MPRIFQTIKKTIIQGVSGAVNFLPRARAGARVTNFLELRIGKRAGTHISSAPTTAAVLERAGTHVGTVNTGDVARPLELAGTRASTRNLADVKPPARAGAQALTKGVVGTVRAPERGAAHISQVRYDLIHVSGVVTASQDPGGNWENLAASQGLPNGAAAFLSGGLILEQGTLRGTFPTQPNRESLTITKVELLFTISITGIQLLENMILGYRVGALGVPHNLETNTANTGGFSTRTFDITAALSGVGGEGLTWATVASMQSFVTANAIVSSLVNHQVDAVRIRVTASVTDVF